MSDCHNLIVIGAGGHAKVVTDAAKAAGHVVIGFLDDSATSAPLPGFEVLGTIAQAETVLGADPDIAFVIAVGDNSDRRRVASDLANLGARFATVVHPSAVISPYARLGEGTVAMAGVVVNAGAVVGSHAILNTSCSVDHDCEIGPFSHLSPGVNLGGGSAGGRGGSCWGGG